VNTPDDVKRDGAMARRKALSSPASFTPFLSIFDVLQHCFVKTSK
jgi:hypothetical protein